MIRSGIKELCELRAEAGRLRQERDDLMRIVSAALVLVNDLDNNLFESYEAAELVAEGINHLPDPLLDEVLRYSRYGDGPSAGVAHQHA